MLREVPESMVIGTRRVGAREPLFVIAEIGLNHGGSVDRALELVDAAAAAGASAVKLQTLFADGLVAPGAPAPAHVNVDSMRDFFAAFELNEEAHHAIAARVRRHGLTLMATPFCESAVDLLERVGVDAYKIASGDLTWDRLIRRCAQTGKPLVMSTGMSSLSEAGRATACARLGGAAAVALLHCVSAYPVPHGSENLRAIATLADAFRLPVGLSDHSDDAFSVPLAVAMGASLYERHLVLSADDGSIDAAVSSTPAELADLIRTAARARLALGAGEKVCLPAEAINQRASRRGLYAVRPLSAGEIVGAADVVALRPAIGLDVNRVGQLVGSRLERDLEEGMPFLERDLAVAAGLQGGLYGGNEVSRVA
jgi:sialic acid synthase SpsE